MKRVFFVLVLILVAGAAYWRYDHGRSGTEEEGQSGSARRTARVEKGDIEITVSASGRIVPEREVEIKSKASGEVIKVMADVSDEVEQGMLLFKLDPADEERSVARLRAGLSMSKAKLAQVKLGIEAAEAKLKADSARAEADIRSAEAERAEYAANLVRTRNLYEQKVVTRESLDAAVTREVQTASALENAKLKLEDLKVQALELERARQEIEIAAAQVDTDSVALADAEQRLKETEVFSPIDGVVSNRTIQEGFIVASGVSNVGGGTTAMKVIDLSRIYAIAAVDESDVSGVMPGVKAIVTADAYKGVEFPGEVVRVAATGSIASNVVTFDVKVEVSGRRKRLLKPEMTTNVVLRIDGKKDVLLVPAAAVVRKAPPGGVAPGLEGGKRGEAGSGENRPSDGIASPDYRRRQSFVTVIRPGGGEEERLVETGLSDGAKMEIISGLSEGEEVLLIQDAGADSRWNGQAGRPPPGPGRR
ncbi:MAG: efflux RND transporter periplasmic adaptor subunit [Planctomycetota bacterium]|jgi:HlyD family secretion protein|nr:efflux RND transporter periplasmic adaptor subunit [Planctomycetota bacterium]